MRFLPDRGQDIRKSLFSVRQKIFLEEERHKKGNYDIMEKLLGKGKT